MPLREGPFYCLASHTRLFIFVTIADLSALTYFALFALSLRKSSHTNWTLTTSIFGRSDNHFSYRTKPLNLQINRDHMLSNLRYVCLDFQPEKKVFTVLKTKHWPTIHLNIHMTNILERKNEQYIYDFIISQNRFSSEALKTNDIILLSSYFIAWG